MLLTKAELMKIDLQGQHIVVTGASQGIGRAVARQLYDSGAALTLTYNKHQQEAYALTADWDKDRFQWIQTDFMQPEAVDKIVEESLHLGAIDTLINNAAIALSTPYDAPSKQWMADWHRTLQVNLHAVASLIHATLPHFIQQQQGRYINISSRAAFRGDTPDYMAYAASKGGLVSLTRSIARGFGRQGIKAFLIAPGFTQTDMARDFIDQYGEAYVTNDLALNTITQPRDLAPLITLLASGLADHATGATFDVNAGSYVH